MLRPGSACRMINGRCEPVSALTLFRAGHYTSSGRHLEPFERLTIQRGARVASPREPERSSLAWVFGIALAVIAAPTFFVGLYLATTNRGWAMLAAGCASIVAVLVAYPLLKTLEASRDASIGCINDLAGPFNERMQQMSVLLNQISEQQLISDRTKQVAYRTRDRETLRRAIHEEINEKDWEAALVLANDMETVFGYKQEAARFRKEIEGKRQEVLRREINEGI